jgi:hypothetical protein
MQVLQSKVNMIKKTKRRALSVLIVLSMLFVFSPQPARADFWGSAELAAFMKEMMETIQRQIEGALLGTLKMAAIQMLNSKVGQLVGGVAGGQPLFITDFNEFLYQNPTQKANLYMNDFFSLTTRGKGSSANYLSAGGTSSLSGNYPAQLRAIAESVTTKGDGIVGYDLEEYAPSPDEMFASGNFRGLNAFFSNPANNAFGYTLQAQKVYQNQLDQERQVAAMKALSSGFIPSEKNGIVMAPASTIEAAITNVQDMGNQMIAAAENPGEILSGAISAMANKLISNMIQKGIGEVQSKITKSINNVDNKVYGAINEQTNKFGPAVQYMGNVNKNLDVIIKTNTPPPPQAIPPDP